MNTLRTDPKVKQTALHIVFFTDGEDKPDDNRSLAAKVRDICSEYTVAAFHAVGVGISQYTPALIAVCDEFRSLNVAVTQQGVFDGPQMARVFKQVVAMGEAY